MVKTCTKCKVEKEVAEFNKYKKAKDGLQYNCKSCRKQYRQENKERIKERNKKYNQANKERRNEKQKEYYQANKEKLKEIAKEYRQDNKEYYKELNKEYRQSNKEIIKQYRKKYYQDNKEREKEYKKEWFQSNKEKVNEYKKEYQRERRKTNPLFKMKCNLRRRTSMAFKNKGYSKNTKTQEMLGVDWEIVKQHIERQFTKGMNWNNQGEWHIDHIIPLASASTSERLKELCHYTNLQPLWAEDNLSKSDKIIQQQTLLRI